MGNNRGQFDHYFFKLTELLIVGICGNENRSGKSGVKLQYKRHCTH